MRLRRNICILLLIAIVMSNSCQSRKTESDCFPGNSQQIGSFPITASKNFPVSSMKGYSEIDSLDQGLSKFLEVLQEPTIIKISEHEDEVYRFLWLRSFDNPISLRMQKSLAEFTLIIKQSDGKGGYDPGKLNASWTKKLSVWQWMKFKSLLESECFWTMDYTAHELAIIDGAWWQLEGKRENRYHIVRKASPTKGKFYEACLYLLELSELSINEKDIY